MSRSQINLFNLGAVLLVLLLWFLPPTASNPIVKLPTLLAVASLILFVPGANLVYLLGKLTRRHYDLASFISLSLLSSLLVPPFGLVLLYQLTGYIDQTTVLLAYTSFLLLPYLFLPLFFFLPRRLSAWPDTPLSFPRLSLIAALRHPLAIVLLLFLALQLFNLTRYNFLPVPDSYSWLIDFSGRFSVNQLPLTTDYTRRSFSAFVAAFFYLSRLDLFWAFKYLFPLLSLGVIPPLWLAARALPSRFRQIVFLSAAVFVSPTVILEVSYIRQQVMFLLFLYFQVGLHLHALLTRDRSLFYVLFFLSLFGTTVHPAFLITVVTGLITLAIVHRRLLWRHQFTAILVAFLLYPLAKKAAIINMFVRLYEQASASFGNLTTARWNLRFPAFYVSSDGYEMSWPGLTGVIKYYAFYAGPVAWLVLLCTTIVILRAWRKKTLRRQLSTYLSHPAALSLVLLFTLFFLIAEIAPRFGNVAFLPERAWQYLSILSIFPLFWLLRQNQPRLQRSAHNAYLLPALLLLATIPSAAGAGYINNLNKYSMPDYEFKAAKWMRDNLPSNSLVYSSSSKNIIRYHADKNFIGLGADMYGQPEPKTIIDHLYSQLDLESAVASDLNRVSALLSDIREQSATAKLILDRTIARHRVSLGTYQYFDETFISLRDTITAAQTHLDGARIFHRSQGLLLDDLPSIYIFYSATHSKNLLSTRPYKSSFTANLKVSAFPALDHNPSYFTRVYTADNVIIWQVDPKRLADQ